MPLGTISYLKAFGQSCQEQIFEFCYLEILTSQVIIFKIILYLITYNVTYS